MNIDNLNLANSILEVKASGSLNIAKDLLQPEGKSIAELLYESESNDKKEQKDITE